MVQIWALESTGSAKTSYKIQGSTVARAAVRDNDVYTRTYSDVSIKTVKVFLLKKVTPCQKRFRLEVENSKNLVETQSSHRRYDKLFKNTKMLTAMSTMHSSCPWTRAIPAIFISLIFVSVLVRDCPLENLSGVGGGRGAGGRRTMKIFARGKINEKKFMHAN